MKTRRICAIALHSLAASKQASPSGWPHVVRPGVGHMTDFTTCSLDVEVTLIRGMDLLPSVEDD